MPTERGDRMYGLTRATTTLIAAGVAGLLIWIATQVNDATAIGMNAIRKKEIANRGNPHFVQPPSSWESAITSPAPAINP